MGGQVAQQLRLSLGELRALAVLEADFPPGRSI